MTQFNTVAKLTQAKYGTNSTPAVVDRCQNKANNSGQVTLTKTRNWMGLAVSSANDHVVSALTPNSMSPARIARAAPTPKAVNAPNVWYSQPKSRLAGSVPMPTAALNQP